MLETFRWRGVWRASRVSRIAVAIRRVARRRGTVTAVLRALSVPAGNDRGPLYMDQALAALHAGMPPGAVLTLGIVRHAGEVTLCCQLDANMQGIVEGQLYAQYPDAKITALPDQA